MIENATPADASASVATIKTRYAPPNQRSRSLNRRKSSGDRSLDRTSSTNLLNEGEKIKNVPTTVDGEPGTSSNPLHSPPDLITLHGCSRSEAAHLLTHRWVAAVNSYNDPSIDLSERPLMYSGAGASAWGQSRVCNQMDFLTELRRAICNANAGLDA